MTVRGRGITRADVAPSVPPRNGRLPASTQADAARNAAQNELFAAVRSSKMAQEAGDAEWIKRADIREARARATLAGLDAK